MASPFAPPPAGPAAAAAFAPPRPPTTSIPPLVVTPAASPGPRNPVAAPAAEPRDPELGEGVPRHPALAPPSASTGIRMPTPLGFGEVDLGGTVLGDEEEFPFETDTAPPSEPAASVAATRRGEAPASAAPARELEAAELALDRSPAKAREADSPGRLIGPDPDPNPDHTDFASMLPEPTDDGAPATLREQPVDDSATLEALFDTAPPAGAADVPEEAHGHPLDSSVGRITIRRRSGTTLGPFAEAEIVEMIDKGEILGNEEVSDGQASYVAISSVPSFAEAIRRHTEALHLAAARDSRSTKQAPETGPDARRVERPHAGARASNRAGRWKWIALGVAIAVALVGAGGALTRYGPFFHRLLRGHTGAHRPGAKLLADARVRLADDRFDGVKAAVELADRALRLYPSDDEAKATYTYAVSVLARRHGGAAMAWSRARAFLPELTRSAGSDPEAAKAVVSAALLTGDRPPDTAVAQLKRLAASATRDGDVLLLLGDLAAARGNGAQAGTYYAKLEAFAPGAARSSHARGVLAARSGDPAGAQKLLEAALARDPAHLDSAVELARLALAAGEPERAEALARGVLAPEMQERSGPRERAEARTVLGLMLARVPSDDLPRSLASAEREFEAAIREDPEDVEARLALAAFQLDRGAAETAGATLAAVAPSAARDRRITAAQARVLAAQGKSAEAERLVDAALEKAPGNARLLFARGLLAFEAGKQGDADKLWSEAAARDPAAWEPHLAIGRARLQRGDLDGAEKELKLASERTPAAPQVLCAAADLLLAREDVAGAEAGYRRALGVDAAQGEPYLGLARIAVARGDAALARRHLQRAVALSPRLAAAQALYGEILWKARDLVPARKALEAAVALDAHDAMSRTRLGAIELEGGERDAALANLQAAATLDVSSAEIRAWYGRALFAKGEMQPAIEQLRKAVELDPDDASAYLQLGRALERVANLGEAADAFRAAQQRAPRMADGYEALGMLYAAQTRCKEALPQLQRAAALAPQNVQVRVAVADCKARVGRYAEAIEIYRAVLSANPKRVDLYYKIARAQHEGTGSREAFPWYERAAREEPGNPMPHYYLAFAYKERSQAAKAIAEFREYLRIKPDAEDRKDIEREVEDLGDGAAR